MQHFEDHAIFAGQTGLVHEDHRLGASSVAGVVPLEFVVRLLAIDRAIKDGTDVV